jgi:4-amino-4-deoxy-L-arabinose transferase-like glycosyltransferase
MPDSPFPASEIVRTGWPRALAAAAATTDAVLLAAVTGAMAAFAAALAPWTLYLPGAASAVLGGRVGGPRLKALLVGWAAPVFLMFTIIATKLPHYLLPVWPALALAVGGTLAAGEEGRLDERDLRWLRRGAWLFAPVALLEAAGLFAVVTSPPLVGLRWPCLALALAILGTAFAALRRHLGGDLSQGARLLCAGGAGEESAGRRARASPTALESGNT